MSRDLEFFATFVPEKIDSGPILIDLKEIKFSCIEQIQNYISAIQNQLSNHFLKILKENDSKVNDLIKKIRKVPNDINEYIENSKYIRSSSFKETLGEIQSDFDRIQFIEENIETYSLVSSAQYITQFVEACCWTKQIKSHKKEAKKKLLEMRQKFKGFLEERRIELWKEFNKLKIEIEPFENYHERSNAYLYASTAKNIFQILVNLNEGCNTLNYQEKFLNYGNTDFAGNLKKIKKINNFFKLIIHLEVKNAVLTFERTMKLWDYADKWKFVIFFFFWANFV